MDATHLDRQAVQTLFGVGERRARQWMAGLAGIRAGNAVAVSRRAFRDSHPASCASRSRTPRTLAAKLVELSQAMAHDWTGFMRTVEE